MTDQIEAASARSDAADDDLWAKAISDIYGAEAPQKDEKQPDPVEPDAPAQDDEPPAEAAEEAPPPAEATEKPDPWADAPEPLRAAYQAAEEARKAAEERWNRHRNQISGLNRKIAELQAQVSQPAPTQKSDDKIASLETLREEYPELADKLAPIIDGLTAKVQSLEAVASRVETQSETSVIEAVEQAHAGFEDLLAQRSADFWEWAEDQPKRIRDIVAANADAYRDAKGLVEVIGAFKAHLGLTEQPPASAPASTEPRPDTKRARQLAGAATPAPRSRGVLPDPGPIDEDALWNKAVGDVVKKFGKPQ